MKITADMLRRYGSGKLQLTDPCIICGGALVASYIRQQPGQPSETVYLPGHSPAEACGHDLPETEQAIKQIRALTPDQRSAILSGSEA